MIGEYSNSNHLLHLKNCTFEEVLGDDARSLSAAPDSISDVAEVVLARQEVSGLKTTVEHGYPAS